MAHEIIKEFIHVYIQVIDSFIISPYLFNYFLFVYLIKKKTIVWTGMTESLKAHKVITLPSVGLFADGAAVRTVGSETFRVRTVSIYSALIFTLYRLFCCFYECY